MAKPTGERTLIAAAKQGNVEASNQLILSYQQLAYDCACRMLGDCAAAEQAIETGFLAAYHSIHLMD